MAKKKSKSKEKKQKKLKEIEALEAVAEDEASVEPTAKKAKKKKKAKKETVEQAVIEPAPEKKKKKKKKKAEKAAAEVISEEAPVKKKKAKSDKQAKKKDESGKAKKKDEPGKAKKAKKTKKAVKPAKEKKTKEKAQPSKQVAPVDVQVSEAVPARTEDVAAPLDTAVGDQENDLLLGISQVYRLSTQDLQNALKDKDISASQWEILATLSADQSITQQELARTLFVSEGNITQMLSKMEKLGWVDRKREWRTNHVTLSAAGDALKKSVQSVYENVNDQFFAELTLDEREQLQRLLETLLPEETPEN